ncbi:hypothetical protein N24_1170 [Corynebacterium suranareeae]|uniref:Carboxymuconolactone decarboxylase-like domain-containing protein n=1 Tax=Corynebacterium suranareeae TaxID=2506452 RepID=A0A169RU56_9CORY|nr:carboxymuconolactone decarboxylase family protein [Corynebacterium suranareeae]BAU95432.1 hypothetical protein N24_1170 [Corynebacterium suranareeae]
MGQKVTAGRDILGEFAPKFAELNDDVLFGQVRSRESELSPRDRSIVTVTTLMASGVLDSSFESHVQRAKGLGCVPHREGHLHQVIARQKTHKGGVEKHASRRSPRAAGPRR